MNGSLDSVTLHLMEQHSQPLARSFDPHFEGGDTDTGDHRHVIVPQFLDVLQEECLPLIRIEALQGAIQFFSPCRALGRVLLGGAVERDFVVTNVRSRRPRRVPAVRQRLARMRKNHGAKRSGSAHLASDR